MGKITMESLKELRVNIKREKLSLENIQKQTEKEKEKEKSLTKQRSVEKPAEETMPREAAPATVEANITKASSVTSSSTITKKKKKHVPIKVERFSDFDKPKNSAPKSAEQKSVYEDAVDDLPANNAQNKENVVNDQTITICNKTTTMPVVSDATFCANDKTITISSNNNNANKIDETFDVVGENKALNNSLTSSKHSMVTANDNVSNTGDDSLITEDESNPETPTLQIKVEEHTQKVSKKYSKSTAANKKDIITPFAESPVKLKIKAFESKALANQAAIARSKENKPQAPNSNTPSSTGKLRSAALGRFLTPTQASNLTPKSMSVVTQAKKAPSSASKATTLLKSNSAKVKSTSTALTGSAKALSRENSADEIRRLNEERRKQREQKHMQAAQLREAKERERAERIAKFAKEREEKLQAKKQAEAEQRKQEELQRKLRAQQEAAEAEMKKKAAQKLKIAEQERVLLKQLNTPSATPKPSDLMPPPAIPKLNHKYCFEMLHEDDSTDDEDKVTFKRPPAPGWSRRGKREHAILMQQHFPSSIIDEYFSVAPTTFDLRVLFPNIDRKHLKRNSSAFWSTPPRYSELPKY